MKKLIYLAATAFAFVIIIYFYFINFNNMSETELVNSVLYWYVPLIFGLYGITALRISKTIHDSDTSAVKHLFSGKDSLMTVLAVVLLILGGLIGILLFFIPLTIFAVRSKHFDISVASVGLFMWLGLLVFFFEVLWPSL